MDATVIEIPGMPAYALNPNGGNKHWAAKAKEVHRLKWDTSAVCRMELMEHGADAGMDGPVNLHWTVYLAKGRRQLDRDNMTICLKPAQDGLVVSEMIVNDTQDVVRAITVDQIKWAQHRGQPKIVVKIERAA